MQVPPVRAGRHLAELLAFLYEALTREMTVFLASFFLEFCYYIFLVLFYADVSYLVNKDEKGQNREGNGQKWTKKGQD